MAMPSVELPEMTLPAPAAVPPMTLAEPWTEVMPWPTFGSAASPVASVPMKLPTTTFGTAYAPVKRMPVPFPEMTFRAAASKPPMRLSPDQLMMMPVAELGLADAAPAESVPR
jgi:hypothetical protein